MPDTPDSADGALPNSADPLIDAAQTPVSDAAGGTQADKEPAHELRDDEADKLGGFA